MIEGCRHKTRGDVALTAITVGWHVIAGLAHGEVAVVALGAVIDRAVVIELGAGECGRVVAGRTVLCRRNMHQRLASS